MADFASLYPPYGSRNDFAERVPGAPQTVCDPGEGRSAASNGGRSRDGLCLLLGRRISACGLHPTYESRSDSA